MLSNIVLEKKQDIKNYVKNLWISVELISDENLFLQAFVHKSFAADSKILTDHNERLEFLWDGILGAVINKMLFTNHPEMDESDLTLYKIALVREEILAEVARDIWLDKIVFVSKGEEKMQWRKKDAILADCLEALIWYIYVDLNISEVENFINKYIYSKIDKIDKKPVKSYKTLIQELIQKEYKIIPEYVNIENKLDDKKNVLEYKSEIHINWEKKSEWFGSNKKKAEEDSAMKLYHRLRQITTD